MASRWRHCVDLTGPGIEPQIFRTDSVRFATELTAGPKIMTSINQSIFWTRLSLGGRGAAVRVGASKHLDPLQQRIDALLGCQGETN